MKVIIFGAAGDIGSRLVHEAVSQGHSVTAVVRRPEQQDQFATEVKVVLTDIGEAAQLEGLVAGHDQIISAVRPASGQEDLMEGLTRKLLQVSAASDIPITLVGGAARLKLPDNSGHTVLSAPDFLPASVVPIAKACFAQYQICLANHQAKWIYATPPALIRPGVRTGQYRFGTDELVTNEEGNSTISMEDFACAILEQIEMAAGYHRAFTAAY